MDGYKESVEPIISKFKKLRQTRFAKSNNVTIDNIHVHNQIPVWYLVKLFKTKYHIKSRLFKSLSDEQKANWLSFYDQNKILVLMTTENHDNFHKNNAFDVKIGTWKITQQLTESKEINDNKDKITNTHTVTNTHTATNSATNSVTGEHVKKRVRVKKNKTNDDSTKQ